MSCVSYFNKKLRERNCPYWMSDRSELYRLHIAKRNGKPKEDLPRTLSPSPLAIDGKQVLGDINFSKFAISYQGSAIVPAAANQGEEKPTVVTTTTQAVSEKINEAQEARERPKFPVADREEKQCCCLVL